MKCQPFKKTRQHPTRSQVRGQKTRAPNVDGMTEPLNRTSSFQICDEFKNNVCFKKLNNVLKTYLIIV